MTGMTRMTRMSRMTGMTWVTRALSIINLSEMTGQLIPIIMRILVLTKLTIQISQMLNIIHKGNGFSAKPLGKCLLYLKKGLAGQF